MPREEWCLVRRTPSPLSTSSDQDEGDAACSEWRSDAIDDMAFANVVATVDQEEDGVTKAKKDYSLDYDVFDHESMDVVEGFCKIKLEITMQEEPEEQEEGELVLEEEEEEQQQEEEEEEEDPASEEKSNECHDSLTLPEENDKLEAATTQEVKEKEEKARQLPRCSFCESTFPTPKRLRRHVRKSHFDEVMTLLRAYDARHKAKVRKMLRLIGANSSDEVPPPSPSSPPTEEWRQRRKGRRKKKKRRAGSVESTESTISSSSFEEAGREAAAAAAADANENDLEDAKEESSAKENNASLQTVVQVQDGGIIHHSGDGPSDFPECRGKLEKAREARRSKDAEDNLTRDNGDGGGGGGKGGGKKAASTVAPPPLPSSRMPLKMRMKLGMKRSLLVEDEDFLSGEALAKSARRDSASTSSELSLLTPNEESSTTSRPSSSSSSSSSSSKEEEKHSNTETIGQSGKELPESRKSPPPPPPPSPGQTSTVFLPVLIPNSCLAAGLASSRVAISPQRPPPPLPTLSPSPPKKDASTLPSSLSMSLCKEEHFRRLALVDVPTSDRDYLRSFRRQGKVFQPRSCPGEDGVPPVQHSPTPQWRGLPHQQVLQQQQQWAASGPPQFCRTVDRHQPPPPAPPPQVQGSPKNTVHPSATPRVSCVPLAKLVDPEKQHQEPQRGHRPQHRQLGQEGLRHAGRVQLQLREDPDQRQQGEQGWEKVGKYSQMLYGPPHPSHSATAAAAAAASSSFTPPLLSQLLSRPPQQRARQQQPPYQIHPSLAQETSPQLGNYACNNYSLGGTSGTAASPETTFWRGQNQCNPVMAAARLTT